jgi:hypothetical protein
MPIRCAGGRTPRGPGARHRGGRAAASGPPVEKSQLRDRLPDGQIFAQGNTGGGRRGPPVSLSLPDHHASSPPRASSADCGFRPGIGSPQYQYSRPSRSLLVTRRQVPIMTDSRVRRACRPPRLCRVTRGNSCEVFRHGCRVQIEIATIFCAQTHDIPGTTSQKARDAALARCVKPTALRL